MLCLRLSLVYSLVFSISAAFSPTLPRDCPCGYVDLDSDRLFTEAIIVYFNETKAIDPEVLTIRSFQNKKEKGRYSIFRQGATSTNVETSNKSTLWLFVDKYTPNHLVSGAELRTVRQDIQYGSFRASMRSPARQAGGSALSMMLKYNDSESLNLDLLNMDDPRNARVTNLVNGELPTDAIAPSYISLQNDAAPVTPWDFVDYRMDWTDYNVTFWAGADRTRSVEPDDRTLPTIPQPLYLSHWSTGDRTYMQGPPANRSGAEIAWIRTFFNSSLMTAQEHRDFDSRCEQWMACSMDDTTLRGSSPYVSMAKLAFKMPPRNEQLKVPAALVAGICSFFGMFALVNAFIRIVPWHALGWSARGQNDSPLQRQTSFPHRPQPPPRLSGESERGLIDPDFVIVPPEGLHSGQETPSSFRIQSSGYSTPGRHFDSQGNTPWRLSNPLTPQAWTTSSGLSPLVQDASANQKRETQAGATITERNVGDEIVLAYPSAGEMQDTAHETYSTEEKDPRRSENITPVVSSREWMRGGGIGALTSSPSEPRRLLSPKSTEQRADYLAGLVALACLLVSLRQFALTFWPYVAVGYGADQQHYAAERWLYFFVGGYLLTPLWIGPFLMTSSRSLAVRYLRQGTLVDVAKGILLQGPRLLVPVSIVAMLEYFLITLGLVASLDWLPSISWSSWPYMTPQSNFGFFVNNIVELAYFIPNVDRTPEIVDHFGGGVLWIIPIQLQLSYVVLLAAVMVRDMRVSWKRFRFYACCIALGWYARSWSALFWLDLLLADLEVTYGWTKWTQSRPHVLYPVLTAATILALGTPLLLVFNLQFSFLTVERGIHPDFQTGQPLSDTARGGYPNYYEPNLAILMFSVSLQVIADLSTWIQAFLSVRPLLRMRDHIMTVYLINGFVFWSFGAWVCVTLSAVAGIPYWANLLLTLVFCYIIIALVSLVLTRLIDFTTRATVHNVWRWASEEPVPWTPTTGKFTKALIQGRSNLEVQAKEA